jgi:hypothetical protein
MNLVEGKHDGHQLKCQSLWCCHLTIFQYYIQVVIHFLRKKQKRKYFPQTIKHYISPWKPSYVCEHSKIFHHVKFRLHVWHVQFTYCLKTLLISSESDCSIDCRLAKKSGADGANICPTDSAVTPPNSWPHATFDTSCGASKTYTLPVPAAYTCGPRGTWNPWNAMRPFAWPKCTGKL